MENVKRDVLFKQVCVWPGTIVGQESIEEFQEFFLKEFNTRIQYLEEIKTNPNAGESLEESGGRNDVFFAVHDDDIGHFAVPRLKMGIRWIEDVLSNINGYSNNPLYPKRVFEYKTWEADSSFDEDQ